jgi:hypothetical protein
MLLKSGTIYMERLDKIVTNLMINMFWENSIKAKKL